MKCPTCSIEVVLPAGYDGVSCSSSGHVVYSTTGAPFPVVVDSPPPAPAPELIEGGADV
jgi:hypothetical protein